LACGRVSVAGSTSMGAGRPLRETLPAPDAPYAPVGFNKTPVRQDGTDRVFNIPLRSKTTMVCGQRISAMVASRNEGGSAGSSDEAATRATQKCDESDSFPRYFVFKQTKIQP
jgi:hypothetical protein